MSGKVHNTTEIQQRLIQLGFLAPLKDDGTSNADGRFGTTTLGAYNRFRASKGEPPHTGLLLLTEISADVFPEDAPPKPVPLPSILDIFKTTDALNKGDISMIPASVADYVINFLTSKIVWFAGVAAVAIIGFINTKFGLTLDDATTKAVSTILVAILGGGVAILRTFFNNPKVVNGAKIG